ncbi:hypothetical protein DK419_02785 [Methylobacterium terrae]|uniref:Uncharacterized protein n=2 Tax=Methylobacterium terrae TaxID=2202827 RepID=A0A2U8WGL0_9HYPH|nr:hypothetical protein DK419_02785 [Methylobacterium terrae]
MTVRATRRPPSLQQAARSLGVRQSDMDRAFGVVPIDPDRGLFAVKVRSASVAVQGEAGGNRFSNPRIAPFGRK